MGTIGLNRTIAGSRGDGPTRGRKSPDAPGRFGRGFNELRNYLYPVQAVAETFQPPLAGNAFFSGIVAPRVLEAT